MKRLAIVSDAPVLGQSLQLALATEGFATIVTQARGKVEPIGADIILLVTGPEYKKQAAAPLAINRLRIVAPIVVLNLTGDKALSGACISAGAKTVVSGTVPLQHLSALLSTVASGRCLGGVSTRLQPDCKLETVRADDEQTKRRLDELTKTEAEVLRHLMGGLTVRQIALMRHVSEPTVRTQVQAILSKLGVHSQLAAVVAAYEANF